MSEHIFSRKISINPNRPTIIFLHDSLGCNTLWRDFPDQLCKIIQCNGIIYDRQGYGESAPFEINHREIDYLAQEADILSNLIDDWRLNDVYLFGHSDGGSIALLAAAKYPSLIKGIITEGAHIYVEDITLDGIRDALHLYQTSNLRDRLKKYHGDKTDKLFSLWADTWLSPEFKDWNIEHILKHIQCPSLIIQGAEDEYGSVNQVHDIVNQISGIATPLVIPNTKHTPHKEAPNLVIEQITNWIK